MKLILTSVVLSLEGDEVPGVVLHPREAKEVGDIAIWIIIFEYFNGIDIKEINSMKTKITTC